MTNVCPNCGYCPHCGRGSYTYPVYPIPYPIYPGVPTSTGDVLPPYITYITNTTSQEQPASTTDGK